MKRYKAIKIICEFLNKKGLVISPTGNISRELFIIGDSPQNFYMMGSMGLTSSIGLGLAVCFPKRRIIVMEGDGSILMNMGSLATIGHYSPKNLIHVILDNEIYDSTGGQYSVSKTANLNKVAQSAGYKIVRRVSSEKKLRDSLKQITSSTKGPIFILVKVGKGGIYDRIPRVPYTPEEITTYFQKFIKKLSRRIKKSVRRR